MSTTPAPTKSSKTPSRPYYLFECVKKRTAKSTKAPTPSPNTSPSRKLQTTSPKTSKSSKCTKSPKSATPAPTAASTPSSDGVTIVQPESEPLVEIAEVRTLSPVLFHFINFQFLPHLFVCFFSVCHRFSHSHARIR